ncbi:response regulator transcription factor [Nocardioides sp. NPDC051685]|uniref:response regulator transcription factor n=1 Tax=Nocardioides sp. NPDC051685 TaxID=3364334 RepID=UPI0037964DF5
MTRILAIEDEPDVALVLRVLFERSGYGFDLATNGRVGLRKVHDVRPDLVVLDVGLPEMDGWTVLERVRDFADVPILMLSAHSEESEKVRGLRGGADDYLAKPFNNNELLARVEALLRRVRSTERADRTEAGVYDDGVVRVDLRQRQVEVDGRPVDLTRTEFRLLSVLVQHAGAVLSPNQLLDQVWNDPTGIAPERVKFVVLRLRRKLGWSGDASPIAAVRGVGYRYRPQG